MADCQQENFRDRALFFTGGGVIILGLVDNFSKE